jgi:hypothetical protein
MFADWAFARHGCGVIVLQPGDRVTVLEFNEFLRRIAEEAIQAEDFVVGPVFTDGFRRRAGELRLFEMVRSGAIRTDDLPRRMPGGVLATGEAARALLRAVEKQPYADADTLLRAAALPVGLPQEMLRAAAAALTSEPPEELPRPSAMPGAPSRPEPG